MVSGLILSDVTKVIREVNRNAIYVLYDNSRYVIFDILTVRR